MPPTSSTDSRPPAFPVHQDTRVVRRGRLLDPAEGVRLPVEPGMDIAHNRTWRSSDPPAPASRHTLIGLGVAAIHAGHKVRYFTAADLVETLYRGLADNTVGKIIESLLRVDLIILDELGFAPLDDTGTQLLVPARRRRLRTPIPGHRLALALPRMGPIPARADHRGQHPRPPAAPRHRRHHRRRVLPHEGRPTPKGEPQPT